MVEWPLLFNHYLGVTMTALAICLIVWFSIVICSAVVNISDDLDDGGTYINLFVSIAFIIAVSLVML
jgi:hypothetical protein